VPLFVFKEVLMSDAMTASPIFEFIGFVPAPHVSEHAAAKIARVFSESPSDSFARAFVRKTVKGFEGRLQVRSTVGTFMAEVIGEDPAQVVDKLSLKIRSQIRLWKRQRFSLS
jgi:hypothetical protein